MTKISDRLNNLLNQLVEACKEEGVNALVALSHYTPDEAAFSTRFSATGSDVADDQHVLLDAVRDLIIQSNVKVSRKDTENSFQLHRLAQLIEGWHNRRHDSQVAVGAEGCDQLAWK